MAEARARSRSAVEALAAAEQAVAKPREDFLRGRGALAVELAIAIAEKIVGGAVAPGPEIVLDVVCGALLRTADPRTAS